MPNPTTLTVKVPEGINHERFAFALAIALTGYDGIIPREDEAVIERRKQHRLRLNPNVLDPEDAVLVARVLGAVLCYPDDHAKGMVAHPSQQFKWDNDFGRLVDCDDNPYIGGRTMEFLNGLVILSIPSLGLTR